MRKFLFAIVAFGILSSMFAFKANAYQTILETDEYLSDTTVTLNLTARPQGTENAVSINLVAEGMTVLNYTPPTGDWIGPTADCENDQTYTTNTVCASLAKPTSIELGESLGTITVKVKGSTYATLTKTSESAYSDGNTIRSDSGVLAEFNTTLKPASAITPSDAAAASQPLVIVAALVVVVVLLALMLWPKIKSRMQKQPESTTPF